jgi:hypothetical protein
MYGSVLAHPLLETLIEHQTSEQRLRETIVKIIESTELREKTRGVEALHKVYMGKLMERFRGKVKVGDAERVVKEEMERRLEFIPEGKKMFSVRVRTSEELEEEEGKLRA